MEKRTSKKSQIAKRGIVEFGFDFNKEFQLWLYITGEEMHRNEWKTVNKLDLTNFTTSDDWKNHIRQKYNQCTATQLNEFIHYLNVVKTNKASARSVSDYFYTTFITAAISFIVTFYLNKLLTDTTGMDFLTALITTVIYVLIFVVLFAVFFIVLSEYYFDFNRNASQAFFIESYIKTIKEMLLRKSAHN